MENVCHQNPLRRSCVYFPVVDRVHDFAAAAAAKSFQSCPTLCDPIVGSPPGSPVPGILQARTLEWVAIAFSASLYQMTSNHPENVYTFLPSLFFFLVAARCGFTRVHLTGPLLMGSSVLFLIVIEDGILINCLLWRLHHTWESKGTGRICL